MSFQIPVGQRKSNGAILDDIPFQQGPVPAKTCVSSQRASLIHRFVKGAILPILCLMFSFTASFSPAEDFIVNKNETKVIDTNTTLTDATYNNAGTVQIDGSATLTIEDSVKNTSENKSGLVLGVVDLSGIIDSKQSIIFADGSKIQIGSSILADGDIIFGGHLDLTGGSRTISADTLNFAATSSTGEDAKTVLNTRDTTLNIDHLLINRSMTLSGDEDTTINLGFDLSLGTSGVELISEEDLIVEGNFSSAAGTVMKINKDENGHYTGSLTFKGGGTLEDQEKDYNNIIALKEIHAGNVTLENKSYIQETLTVTGNMILGEDSKTHIALGLKTEGKFTVDQDAIVTVAGNYADLGVYFGGSLYNGVFLGGLELKKDSSMSATNGSSYLILGLGKESQIGTGAKLSAKEMYISGLSSTGTELAQNLINAGEISVDDTLYLSSIKLKNDGNNSVVKAQSIYLYGESVLDVTDGKLDLSEGGGVINIQEKAKISAGTSEINFGSATVYNYNGTDGLTAGKIIFDDGGAYYGIFGTEDGVTKADAHFKKGATMVLHSYNYSDFGDHDIVLDEGAILGLSIGNAGVGALMTTGTITFDKGVIISVVGSTYQGRSKKLLLASGDDATEYNEDDILLNNTLFFTFSDLRTEEITDEDDNVTNKNLYVDVTKSADLVDYAGSTNQWNLARQIDVMIADNALSQQQQVVVDALMLIPTDEEYRHALDMMAGIGRENSALFVLNSPWRNPLDHIYFGGISLALNPSNQFGSDQSRDKRTNYLGQGDPYLSRRAQTGFARDLWFHSFYHYDEFDRDHNSRGGDGSRGGFILGGDIPDEFRESITGFSFGYTHGKYKQDTESIKIDDFRIGLYHGANLMQRNLQFRGYLGFGFQHYKSERSVYFDTLGALHASGNTNGNTFSAAFLLIRPVDVTDRFMIKPTFGIDVDQLNQDGFAETGDGGILLGYKNLDLTRVMARVGVSADYTTRSMELSGRFFYGARIGGDKAASTRHYFVHSPAYGFDVTGINLGTSVYEVGFGGKFKLNPQGTTRLFLDYNGSFTRQSTAHTGSLGISFTR